MRIPLAAAELGRLYALPGLSFHSRSVQVIPHSPTFPPVRVTTEPAATETSPEGAHPASIYEAAELSLSEATDLLDWLENHQIRASEVDMNPAGRVTVRWVAA